MLNHTQSKLLAACAFSAFNFEMRAHLEECFNDDYEFMNKCHRTASMVDMMEMMSADYLKVLDERLIDHNVGTLYVDMANAFTPGEILEFLHPYKNVSKYIGLLTALYETSLKG